MTWTGFSCKCISHANSTSLAYKKSALQRGASVGHESSSRNTFFAAIDIAKKLAPVFVFLENTDAIADLDKHMSSNLDAVVSEFHGIGYAMSAFRLNTKDYAIPQDRLRVFFVGFRVAYFPGLTDWQTVFDQIKENLIRFKRAPPAFEAAVLEVSNVHVKLELKRRQEREQETLMLEVEASHKRGKVDWPEVHRKYVQSHGVRWSTLKVSDSTAQSPWYPFLGQREAECLAFIQHQHGHDVSGDVSQQIFRIPVVRTDPRNNVQVCPTLLTSSVFWIGSGQNRIAIGRDLLGLQGYPWAKVPQPQQALDEAGDSFQVTLAGNAFTSCVAFAVMLSALLAAPLEAEDDFVLAEALEWARRCSIGCASSSE